MNRHYECLLRSIVGQAEQRISELEMRTAEEIRAAADSRQARVAKNASKLRTIRRKSIGEVPAIVAQTGNLSKPDER
ncbi:MAG: hypothetical protein L0Z53_24615 [Acidobacteriales bacterium]|nr:hypothetical protein [Terriglobales bacterium]